MRPIVFDGAFGWLHPGASRHGVVLLGPLGSDAQRAHRAWRELAERLAAAGLPTIRFDYPGLGDSPGDGRSAARLETWIAAAAGAVERLRKDAGVEAVTLVGLRFGAALAMAAADRVGGIDGLGLLAPITSGRAYKRELSLISRLSRQGPGGEAYDALALGEETLADFDEFEPLASAARMARRALILTREAIPPDARLAQALGEHGVVVEHAEFTGYDPLFWNPDFSRYPQAAFARVIEWAAQGPGVAPGPDVCSGEVEIPLAEAHETALSVGSGLAAVVTRPRSAQRDAPMVLLLNTGAIGRIGFGRMWVSLARRLAGLGFTSLRFDIRSVGDSPARPDGLDPVENVTHAAEDVREVLDWLGTKGITSAVLIGFCWGGQLACNVALADPRVAAQILINPRRMFWTAQLPHHRVRSPSGYLKQALDPAVWRGLLVGRIKPHVAYDAARRLFQGLWSRVSRRLLKAEGPVELASRRLRALAERGTDTFVLYGELDPQLPELEEILGVGRSDVARLFGLTFQVLEGADHLISRPAEREALDLAIEAHLTSLFPPPPSPAPPRRRAARERLPS